MATNFSGDQINVNWGQSGSQKRSNASYSNQGRRQFQLKGASSVDLNCKKFDGLTKIDAPDGATVTISGGAYRNAESGDWYTDGKYEVTP